MSPCHLVALGVPSSAVCPAPPFPPLGSHGSVDGAVPYATAQHHAQDHFEDLLGDTGAPVRRQSVPRGSPHPS